jgi:hypothetical protein
MSILPMNQHELSHYILEDIFDCPVGSRFIVCIANDGANLERGEYYLDKAKTIANEVQRSKGNCEHWRMYERRYFIQQACLDRSSHYSEIKMKAVLQHQFVDTFTNEGGDFALQFDDMSTRLTVPWHDIIHASQTIMVFGYPFLQNRSFTPLFWKMKLQHAHHIFRQFTSEYYGDSQACSMLYIEYQQVQLDVATSELKKATNDFATRDLFQDASFKTESAQRFQYWFDRYCKHAFINCMNGYNNYSQLLIVPQVFMNFLFLLKRIFPLQWDFLLSARGVTERDHDDLKEYKERQVFMIILNLQCLANYKSLKH